MPFLSFQVREASQLSLSVAYVTVVSYFIRNIYQPNLSITLYETSSGIFRYVAPESKNSIKTVKHLNQSAFSLPASKRILLQPFSITTGALSCKFPPRRQTLFESKKLEVLKLKLAIMRKSFVENVANLLN